jgi:hypothetical protein
MQYLIDKGYYGNETFPVLTTTAAPATEATTASSSFDVVNDEGTSVTGQIKPSTMRNSCGVQLYAGTYTCVSYFNSLLPGFSK